MRTHSIFDCVIECARRGCRVSDVECSGIVVATEIRAELHVCRTCAHGHALAATSRLRVELPPLAGAPLPQPRPMIKPAAEMPAAHVPAEPQPQPQAQRPARNPKQAVRPAPAKPPRDALMRLQLEKTFAHILPRYPMAKTHGLRFVATVAQQYGFKGDAEDVARVIRAAGLTVISAKKANAVCVDEALRGFAERGEA